MNKHQEALNVIKNTKVLIHMHDDIVSEINVFDEDDMNIELLQELVDKATPKRVVGLSITYDGLVGNCPSCKKFVRQQDSKPNLCECTQQIDWSKDE